MSNSTPDRPVSHYHTLIDQITRGDDCAHVTELLELIHGVADPNSVVAVEVEKHLYSLTADFQNHFSRYMDKLKVA